jgi:hypothetical protein
MDENKDSAASAPSPSPTTSPTAPVAAPARRPSDVDVFLHLLPNVAGSLATKHEGARTVRDLAIGVCRELTGQLVALGICERTTVCLDNQYLASPGPEVARTQPAAVGISPPNPAMSNVPPGVVLGSNNGHGVQGAMVAHFETAEVRKIPTL